MEAFTRATLIQKAALLQTQLNEMERKSDDFRLAKKRLDSYRFHETLADMVAKLFEEWLDLTTDWASMVNQMGVKQIIIRIYGALRVPMHITYKKLGNMFTNKRAALRKKQNASSSSASSSSSSSSSSSKKQAPKRLRDSAPTDDRSNKIAKTSGGKQSKAGSGGKKVAKTDQSKVAKVVKAAVRRASGPSHKVSEVVRIGSTGVALRVGACELGDDEDPLARGTIINLNPNIRGDAWDKANMPFQDGVLVTLTGVLPLQGS